MFRHYLKFISLGSTELYEINEPIGFDSANFVKEQEPKRYARSIEYGSLDKLEFVDAIGAYIENPQIINPQGDSSNYLDYGLSWLLSIYNDFGFESKVEYVLEKDGTQFSYGMLDFTEKDITDGYTYINCKIIQKNNIANLKRRLDDKFNAFGTKNAKQEDITPIATEDILLKGLAVDLSSSWDSPSVFNLPMFVEALTGPVNKYNRWNNCKNIVTDGINDTLTFINDFSADSVENSQASDFKYILATKELFDVKVKISNFSWYQSVDGDAGRCENRFVIFWGTDGAYLGQVTVIADNVSKEESKTYIVNDTFNIPYVPAGSFIYIMMETNLRATADIFPEINCVNLVSKYNIDITVSEKSLDRVIKASRWIDLIKQASLFSCGISVNAPLFESGGEHYNNMVFNRRMISQNIDYFNTTPKISFESINEVNCDYEPSDESIFIGHQGDFYINNEIAVFEIIPSEDFTISENETVSINKIDYKYKNFEQDRLSQNTSLSIHTEAQFLLQNENVENVKELSLDFVRDPLYIQKIVDLEIIEPTTSTDEDDKVCIVNVVDLEPFSYNEFGIILQMRLSDGKLEILNRTSQNGSSKVTNWTTLGFGVGASISIIEGNNIGNYTVFSLDQNILRLTPIGGTVVYFQGDGFIKIKYFYTDVFLTSRSNEGFLVGDFMNQKYSIKRNLKYFGAYLKSCLLYVKKDIINSYFKSNGTFESQLDSEAEVLIENATITYDSLPTPYIKPKTYKLTAYAEFNDILNYLEKYKTDRGFVRTFDSNGKVIKGFVKELNHNWTENSLELFLEEKFDTEYLILTYVDEVLTVNDVIYNLSGISDWWKAENDYFKFYDSNNKPICNFYKYNFINLNGSNFSTKEDLINALLSV